MSKGEFTGYKTQAYQNNSHPNVLSGNPGVSNGSNLAMQYSLMTFLDEFTEVISGELRELQTEYQNSHLNQQG